MDKNQHVIPDHGKWAVKGEGNIQATTVLHTQDEAVKIATAIAKKEHSEVIIHQLSD